MNNIFDISDIIIITRAIMEDLQNEELYGLEEESLSIPQYIEEKINTLEDESCEEFFSIIEDIAKQIYKLKSGELHELNTIHKEIVILAEEKLEKYIK